MSGEGLRGCKKTRTGLLYLSKARYTCQRPQLAWRYIPSVELAKKAPSRLTWRQALTVCQ